ncbi:hypothetical protein X798_04495 [Onchocerca flexuosa]|uniref:Uncharacterized protein n=1 Tax=Onchocerca flexuosa TaxID=387005 RepID=A0A238BUQ6_9BILA|nr:hypothetical protein X798_04495 [Onchocerca flexuosa]
MEIPLMNANERYKDRRQARGFAFSINVAANTRRASRGRRNISRCPSELSVASEAPAFFLSFTLLNANLKF